MGVPKEQPAPDKASREQVTTSPISGEVKRVRGLVSWIEPEDPLDHPEASKHRGRIYLHATDIDGEAPLEGAKVIFSVYHDDTGLGAENCQVVEQGTGEASGDTKPKKLQVKKQHLKQNTDKHKKGANRKAVRKTTSESKGPSGPDLPRERVTSVPTTGEVVVWRRAFGFIRPDAAIDHPDAEKHRGTIYVHEQDVGDIEMKKGKKVSFHVFADEQGLGAEEVSEC